MERVAIADQAICDGIAISFEGVEAVARKPEGKHLLIDAAHRCRADHDNLVAGGGRADKAG